LDVIDGFNLRIHVLFIVGTVVCQLKKVRSIYSHPVWPHSNPSSPTEECKMWSRIILFVLVCWWGW
jgi:hypothetical protein